MAWISFRAGTCASMALRKRMNSWCRVALHIAADNSAVEDIEGREQCRRAMTLVVVGHRPGAALLHRQAGLSAASRLNPALPIGREDDGMCGRIDIATDAVPQLAYKVRVGGELEL